MTGTPRPYLLFLLLAAQPRDSSPATSICASSPIRVNGILGESVVLPFDSEGTFKLITWYRPSPHQDTASGRKVPLAVVTPGEPGALPRLAVEDERYQECVRLHVRSYSLEISNLTLADQGEYKLEQNTIGYNVHFCDYHLTLYQRLSQLEIRIHPVMAGNGTCNVTFTCSTGKGAWNLTFTWTGPAGGAVLSTKESLLVQHRLGDKDTPVTCTAANNVSTSSAHASPRRPVKVPPLPQTPALSYCRTKGLLVLGVLGSLLAGILMAHVLAARNRHGPESRGASSVPVSSPGGGISHAYSFAAPCNSLSFPSPQDAGAAGTLLHSTQPNVQQLRILCPAGQGTGQGASPGLESLPGPVTVLEQR